MPRGNAPAQALGAWFARAGRDLPWRRPPMPGPGPHGWGVLVSEFMLQQTPVDRVVPAWTAWMERWPQPADLAADSAAEAIRAWGRLGYPRRAKRLHESAVVIVERHDGLVPDVHDDLLALPGVGEYTAGAVRAFAYGQPGLALDTNVRRVLARHDRGLPDAVGSVTVEERRRAAELMPAGDAAGAAWMAGLMELGALICTSRAPRCEACPISGDCAWLALGRPAGAERRRQAAYDGSDRQARGALLAVLRASDAPVTQRALDVAWPDAIQRARALDGLVADGLVVPASRNRWSLPS